MFNREAIKTSIIAVAVIVIVYTSILLYRAEYVDPIQDEHYSEIQDWEN